MGDLIKFPGCKCFESAQSEDEAAEAAEALLKEQLLGALDEVRESIEDGKTTAFWCIELGGEFARRMPFIQSSGVATAQELLATAELFSMYARARIMEQIEAQLG